MIYANTKHIKLFKNEPEVTVVEVEQDDKVFAIGKFLEYCTRGLFNDGDGFGKFIKIVDGKKYAIDDILFSIDDDRVFYKGECICSIYHFCRTFNIDEVVWVNV